MDNDGLGKEISETVERVFCRLSGREPPLFPSVNGGDEAQPGGPMALDEKKAEDLDDDANEKERTKSAQKKRSFNDMSTDGGDQGDVANKSEESSALREELGKSPSNK